MFMLFLDIYVRSLATVLPVFAVLAAALAASRMSLSWRETAPALIVLGLLFGVWHGLTVYLLSPGFLGGSGAILPAGYLAAFLISGPLLLVLMGRATRLGRNILAGADQRILIGFQIPRVIGFVFLVGWAAGDIPWQFALPAGVGDVWAGIAALQAFNALQAGSANAERLVWRANIIGLLDFAVAVGTGIATSAGPLQVLAFSEPNIANQYPLALFPLFFVPIFLAAHVFSILRLSRRGHPETAPA
ncbi:hypothetical protein E1180_17240 [Roseibium denhamense]|uniref:MFS transporter n=1 Tax=Roseibium denhamense TaxID=76305 RepID=A0ABY1P4R9_9HYPH|nr:hypothetical protein [Roseibium denhamense]MTI07251.1 hypothetical protein [Roseibium denhamense]SMP26255.1 hypothetical protein SAMN06265374_2699 [Roseibium denhamense]